MGSQARSILSKSAGIQTGSKLLQNCGKEDVTKSIKAKLQEVSQEVNQRKKFKN